ncbi:MULTISPECIES: orotate phosphoribosyltransferase [Sulfurisphaera]|uniref:Orotate phosphoribosyltransferase n=3 Tax=Sulfurisphaera TaxID=69655 RepID=PYRE_SULTO
MDFIKSLVENKLLLIGNFVLTSGKISPYYLDLRRLSNYYEIFSDTVNKAIDKIKNIDFDMIIGIATGGIPFASFISCRMGKPLGYIRMEKKGYGTDKILEADVSGRKILLVDDVATTGGSLSKAVEIINSEGGRVVASLVIVDREEGAEKKLGEYGVKLISVYKIREILEYLLNSSLISDNDKNNIKEYLVKNIE